MERTTREILQSVMEKLNLNQRELGVYAGVSARTMNSWMTGDRQCSEWTAELIERLADHDAKALRNGEPTSAMWRWCLIDVSGIDGYLTAYGSKSEALREGARYWDRLSAYEKKERSAFYVGYKKIQLIEPLPHESPFSSYMDENGDVYSAGDDIAKDWLEK